MSHSPLDAKALAAIAILMNRRETWSVITYGDLADRLGHARYGLGQILDRVGSWCRSIDKESLAMLVIDEEGKPREGMYDHPPGDSGPPVTRQTIDQRRVRLWRQDWTAVAVPTLEQIDAAYRAQR